MLMKHCFNTSAPILATRSVAGCRPASGQDGLIEHRLALIDLHNGQVDRVAAHPVILHTSDPKVAAASLLRNRDPWRWSVQVLH
jgi:hypothetical protein